MSKKPFYKRIWFIIVMIIIVVGIIGLVGGNSSKKKEKEEEYRWPKSELVSLIPKPESKYGKINSESEEFFSIVIYDMTKDQFEDYIDECKESGFTEDYSRLEGYYGAKNTDGISLELSYDDNELSITLNASAETSSELQEETSEDQGTEGVESNAAGENERDEENNLTDGLRPEFKEAMDSYEAFYDRYCELLKKYEENPSNAELVAEYTDMLKKLVDVDEKFAAWEGSDLNSAEMKYYVEVNGRVMQKLLEVTD